MPIVFNILEAVVVRLRENLSGHFAEASEDVSCRGMFFPTLVSGAKLPIRHK